jgi:hypothetical protein
MRIRHILVGLVSIFSAAAYACTIQDVVEVPVGSVEVLPSSITLLEGETHRLTARAKDPLGKDLPSGAVSWSTDAPAVFAIDGDGEGEALVVGQTTVWATLDGVRGSASVSVEAGPRIAVGEPSLVFSMNIGGGAPDPVTLPITNGGGGGLGGISVAVDYPPGGTVGWLSLALARTSAPSTLTLSILPGLLEEGVHEATLVLASPDARNSPIALPVRVVVTLDDPIIGLSTKVLEFRAEATSPPPTPRTVQVTNLGGGVLGDLQALGLYTGVGNWLSVALTGSTAPADLVVQPDPSGLSPGTYAAEVRVNGPGALNDPQAVEVTFTVEVGPPSPEHSTATVTGGTAGLPTTVVTQTRDGLGNLLDKGGAAVGVSVSGANNLGSLTVFDQADGTYTATYTPIIAGADHVSVTLDGSPISGSPFFTMVGPGPVNPAHSTAVVPAGTVGRSTNIFVQARDGNGNPLSSGGATVAITVSGANNPGSLTVLDQANGTYTASYTPTATGADNVAITLNGSPISGSPFTSTVGADVVSPAHSTAVVPDGTAGLPTDIVVQARDESGNPVNSGGVTVAIDVSGANNPGSLTVLDQADGTYTASYTPTTAGTDIVAITMDGSPVSGSPFTSAVGEGAVSPAHSTAVVPDGAVGLPTDIVVQARDESGNPLSSGGATVAITVSGANNPGSLAVLDQADGTYTASYTPTAAGTDNVAINMDGSPVSGSPFTSTVGEGAVSPAHSTAVVPDGTAGLPTNILVQARDGSGNPMSSGGAKVAVDVSGANNPGSLRVFDQGDGTYTAEYTPTAIGTDDVAITIDGTSISGSPYASVVVAGAASPANSTAIVPKGKRNKPTTIVVQARDAFGNPLSVGGEVVVVTVLGQNPTGPILATDGGDGTYTATYTPVDRGDDYVFITMNGTPIEGSPFKSKVER